MQSAKFTFDLTKEALSTAFKDAQKHETGRVKKFNQSLFSLWNSDKKKIVSMYEKASEKDLDNISHGIALISYFFLKKPKKVLNIFHLAEADITLFNLLSTALCSNEESCTAIRELYKKNECCNIPSFYYTALQANTVTGFSQEALILFDAHWQVLSEIDNPDLVNISAETFVIMACLKVGLPSKALKIYREVNADPRYNEEVNDTNKTAITAFHAMGAESYLDCGMTLEAERIIEKYKKYPNTAISAANMNYLLETKRPNKAFKAFSEYSSDSTFVPINSIGMRISLARNNVTEAINTYQKAMDNGKFISFEDHYVATLAYAMQYDSLAMLSYSHILKVEYNNLSPTKHATLFLQLALAGKSKFVEGVYDSLTSERATQCSAINSAMIQIYGINGDVRKAQKLYSENFLGDNLKDITTMEHEVLIEHIIITKQNSFAERVYKELCEAGYASSNIHALMIKLCISSGKMEDAKSMYKQLFFKGFKQLIPKKHAELFALFTQNYESAFVSEAVKNLEKNQYLDSTIYLQMATTALDCGLEDEGMKIYFNNVINDDVTNVSLESHYKMIERFIAAGKGSEAMRAFVKLGKANYISLNIVSSIVAYLVSIDKMEEAREIYECELTNTSCNFSASLPLLGVLMEKKSVDFLNVVYNSIKDEHEDNGKSKCYICSKNHFRIVEIFLEKNQYPQALKAFERFTKVVNNEKDIKESNRQIEIGKGVVLADSVDDQSFFSLLEDATNKKQHDLAFAIHSFLKKNNKVTRATTLLEIKTAVESKNAERGIKIYQDYFKSIRREDVQTHADLLTSLLTDKKNYPFAIVVHEALKKSKFLRKKEIRENDFSIIKASIEYKEYSKGLSIYPSLLGTIPEQEKPHHYSMFKELLKDMKSTRFDPTEMRNISSYDFASFVFDNLIKNKPIKRHIIVRMIKANILFKEASRAEKTFEDNIKNLHPSNFIILIDFLLRQGHDSFAIKAFEAFSDNHYEDSSQEVGDALERMVETFLDGGKKLTAMGAYNSVCSYNNHRRISVKSHSAILGLFAAKGLNDFARDLSRQFIKRQYANNRICDLAREVLAIRDISHEDARYKEPKMEEFSSEEEETSSGEEELASYRVHHPEATGSAQLTSEEAYEDIRTDANFTSMLYRHADKANQVNWKSKWSECELQSRASEEEEGQAQAKQKAETSKRKKKQRKGKGKAF